MNMFMHQLTNYQVNSVFRAERLNSLGIVGLAGSGKGFLAEFLSKKVLDVNDIKNYPYILRLDTSQEKIGIDQIREIKNFLNLKIPGEKKIKRIIIVEHIDDLSKSAQNALLKTLEEPPLDSLLITTVNDLKNILPTIRSRQQWIICRPIEKSQILNIFEAEYSNADIEKAFLLSEGRISLMISILNQKEISNSIILSMEKAKTLLRSSRTEKLVSIDQLTKSEDFSLSDLLESMIKIIKQLIKSNKIVKHEKLIDKLEAIYKAEDQLRYNLSSKLVLTNLFNKL